MQQITHLCISVEFYQTFPRLSNIMPFFSKHTILRTRAAFMRGVVVWQLGVETHIWYIHRSRWVFAQLVTANAQCLHVSVTMLNSRCVLPVHMSILIEICDLLKYHRILLIFHHYQPEINLIIINLYAKMIKFKQAKNYQICNISILLNLVWKEPRTSDSFKII